MTYNKILFFVVAIKLACILCHGQEQKPVHISQVLPQLHLSEQDCYLDLVVEKVLPYAPNQSVLVIPKITHQEEGWVDLDGYILIIDNQTGKVISSYYQPQAWTSDALKLEEIVIDTAPYKINESVRAFGIRVRYHGSSRPNPYAEETLSLFISEGKKLLRVLDNFTVSSYRGEWDMQCEGEFEEENKTLILSSTQTNGFFDLLSKNRITTTARSPKGEECLEKIKKSTNTQILRFSNGEYK